MDNSRRNWLAKAFTGVAAWPVAYAGVALGAPEERVIKIQAKRYAYTPNRIVLRKNEAVVLELTALDFTHGFSIPDWKIRADLLPGLAIRVRLKPESAGEFDFLCDNFCGSGHEEMSGKIVVAD